MISARWLAPALVLSGLAACSISGVPAVGATGGTLGSGGSSGATSGSSGATGGSSGAGGSGGQDAGPPPTPPQCNDPNAPPLVQGTPDPSAWYVHIGGPGDQESNAITSDSQGDVIVAGRASGPTDFGAGMVPAIGPDDLFVAKYDTAGALSWARRFGSADLFPTSVAVDHHDNIVVFGIYTGGPASFDGVQIGAPAAMGDNDLFIVELGPDGTAKWAQRMAGSGIETASLVAVGPDDGVVVSGQDPMGRLLLASFSASGGVRFQVESEPIVGDLATIDAMAVDAKGDIYLAGTPDGSFPGWGPDSPGYVDKHSGADGARLWAKTFDAGPGAGDGASSGAALVLVDDDILLSAPSGLATDLGGGPLAKACPGAWGFIARLSGADGGYRWSRTFAEVQSFDPKLFLDAGGRVVLISNLGGPSDLGGGPASFYGTFASTYDASTGAFVSIRPIVELETTYGDSGPVSSALAGTGHVYLETTFYLMVTTGGGTLTSEGLDVVLMRVPGGP
jgi:hypothetical protein